MQLPITLLTTLCVLFFMPLKKVEGDWRLWVPLGDGRVPTDVINRKLKAVDFLGIFLALAGMTVVILGLTWGGKEYSWNSAQVIATLVVGTAASVAFMLWQWKGPRYPLIPCKKLHATIRSIPWQIRSAHLQVEDRQRRMPDHGYQRLELRHASLLHPLLLPTRLRLLRHQIRSNASPHHTTTNSQ